MKSQYAHASQIETRVATWSETALTAWQTHGRCRGRTRPVSKDPGLAQIFAHASVLQPRKAIQLALHSCDIDLCDGRHALRRRDGTQRNVMAACAPTPSARRLATLFRKSGAEARDDECNAHVLRHL